MHHIVYISAACQEMDSDSLQSILNSAKENNHLHDVTGFLMYHDGQFFQVLEGEKNTLDRCFANILADPRHTGVIKLLDSSCPERCFPDWAMGLARLSQFENEVQSLFIDLLDANGAATLDALRKDKIVSIFANTFLSDIGRLRRSFR